MKPYEKLQRFWKHSDAEIAASGVSEAEIAALEEKYSVRLPDDFRDYLLHSCPKDEMSECDDGITSWWHLDRIKNIPEEYEQKISNEVIASDAAKYIFFADHLFWCWAWAICCDEGENRGRIAVVGGLPDRFVADSFAQFVNFYIVDKDGSRRLSGC